VKATNLPRRVGFPTEECRGYDPARPHIALRPIVAAQHLRCNVEGTTHGVLERLACTHKQRQDSSTSEGNAGAAFAPVHCSAT